MRLAFWFIVFFSCFGSIAQPLTSPQIGCVSVLPNGNVVLTWQVPPDPAGEFAYYAIYSNPAPHGNYTQQALINNYFTNTYTVTGINANTSTYFFCIETITTASVSLLPIDTVRTSYLASVSLNSADSGVAILNWTGLAQPLPAGDEKYYTIYRDYPLGIWTKIASVPLNTNGSLNYTYQDSITVCKYFINYKIVLTDSVLGCSSESNIKGNLFKNRNKPTPPRIDSVSVVTVGGQEQTIIGLSPAYSQDVQCFIIHFSLAGGTYQVIDSICNYNHPAVYTYTSTTNVPTAGSVTLTAISLDSCGNTSQFPGDQSTIYTHAFYDFCSKKATINWTPYAHMITGVDHYEIFYSADGGASYTHLGDTTATTYYQKNLQNGTNYCYYVRAHSVGKTVAGKDTASSTSNHFCITTSNPPVSQYVYLNNVTVNSQQSIDVQWNVDNNVPIGGFNLFRAPGKTGPYSLVKYIPTANIYTDADVNTNSQEYFYYLQVLDTCLNPTIQTDTSNSIVLTAVASGNLTATLNWNSYAKYLGGVSGYNIYRSVNGVFGSPVLVGNNVTTYVDDLSPFAADEGIFVYYVEAIEGPGNLYGLAEKSQSNYDTVYIDANLYIPNSFTPHGKNKVFLPIGAYIDESDYQLNIFDRFGQKIYETTDPNKGWDGEGTKMVYMHILYSTKLLLASSGNAMVR